MVSHPQPSAQCARFLRENLSQAEVRSTDSTAEAVRLVSESNEPWAALGAASAAEIYGCVVLRDGIEDEKGNVTRFAWLAPEGVRAEADGGQLWRTTLIFSELGADHPGALVDALYEISNREVNMTRIESRPRRYELGRYMFFIDMDGADTDSPRRRSDRCAAQQGGERPGAGELPNRGRPAPLGSDPPHTALALALPV